MMWMLEEKNIITALWENNDNLMQLLSMGKGYSKAIEQFNNNYFDQHPDEKNISKRLSAVGTRIPCADKSIGAVVTDVYRAARR